VEVDPEALFGQLAIEKGLARPEQVQECLDQIREMAGAGVTPLPRLAHLLAQKGYLRLDTWERTLRVEAKPAEPPPNGELPPEAQAPGVERFGKYVRTVKLGEGGMGEVWKAWDTELARWVAIKFLKSKDALEIARFRREAQTAARLAHPNIASIYEAGESFIAMQFVEGRGLPAGKPQAPKKIAQILRDAALALQYAHQHTIVHRDVKPGNIMVEPAGRVYVLDFGLAKSTAVASGLSESGAISGTPAYMSPEQAIGSSTLDHRTDIYSLGATLYELLADRPPFTGASAFEVLKKVVEEDPLPIERFNSAADRDLRVVAARCMEKDPARRYRSARELADDLDRYLRDEPILARPLSSSERMRRTVRKHRAILLPTAVAVILGLGVLAALTVSALHASASVREALAAAERCERSSRLPFRERRDLALEARGKLNRARELDGKNPKVRDVLARIEALLAGLLKEEDDRLDREERIRKISRVHVLWGRIHETLEELDGAASDVRPSRNPRTVELWDHVRAFLRDTAADESSQSASHALAGWACLRLLRSTEGEDLFRKSSALDSRQPYAFALQALAGFCDSIERPELDDRSFATKAFAIRNLVDQARTRSQWVEDTRDEFELIFDSMRALSSESPGDADPKLGETLRAPEVLWMFRDLRMIRARARFLAGNGTGAVEDQDKVARIRRWHPPTRYWLARYKMAVPSLRPEALTDFEDVLRLDPKCLPAWVRKGEILEASGRFPEAAEAYDEALRLRPGDADLKKRWEQAKSRAP